MHRSRIYAVLIDTPHDQAHLSVAFWSNALGATAVPAPAGDDPYTELKGLAGDLTVHVQGVDDEPRYHIDIETDDVEAETARLISHGATEEARHDGWVVLRAPGGQLLCVVPIQGPRELFDSQARTWSD